MSSVRVPKDSAFGLETLKNLRFAQNKAAPAGSSRPALATMRTGAIPGQPALTGPAPRYGLWR